MPLVIYGLGGGTHTHLNTHTYFGPLQIDFLFPILAKQNLTCGRAVNSIIPLCKLPQFDTITDALYMSIYKVTW